MQGHRHPLKHKGGKESREGSGVKYYRWNAKATAKRIRIKHAESDVKCALMLRLSEPDQIFDRRGGRHLGYGEPSQQT